MGLIIVLAVIAGINVIKVRISILYSSKTSTSRQTAHTNIEPSYSGALAYANGCVYYTDNSKLYRVNIGNGVSEELGKAYYGLTDVNGSLASVSDGGLKLIDYNGNEITTVRP